MHFVNYFTQNSRLTFAKFIAVCSLSVTLIACGDGSDGSTALVATVAIPAGSVCAGGGTQINIGKDSNQNGILDTNEVLSSSVVCNGLNGSPGAQGPQGPAGPKGTNAIDLAA